MTHLAVTSNEVHGYIDATCDALQHERELPHSAMDDWPVAPDTTALAKATLASTQRGAHFAESIHEIEDGIACITIEGGGARVRAFGNSPQHAARVLDAVREIVPRGENPDPDVIPVTFWTYSPHGARSIRRDLDAASWTEIAGNYTEKTGEGVGRLMAPDFRPGVGGQLVLWHGDPGTGKTTALRALAREWRSWLDIHYVVDPDHFFGAHADYMMDVLMGGHFEELSVPGQAPEPPRWRLLVLEDCGEMLQPDARREVGQALSRFLNACDGLIGRGLRVLVLVTTNEPVAKLHEAVSRPGRCAARVEFERFDVSEAQAWLAERDAKLTVADPNKPTLADLFGIVEGFRQREQTRRPMGFAA